MPNQVNENTGIEMLLRGISLNTVEFDRTSDIDAYVNQHDLLDVEPIALRGEHNGDPVDHWFIPEPYASLDVAKYLYDRCKTLQERKRVSEELELFRAKNLDNMLRLMIYIVQTMEDNQVVWGVGRGSSVASYCLYLIGVHCVDSIRYNLDIQEFLKEDQNATTQD